jgi:hypothetical protein
MRAEGWTYLKGNQAHNCVADVMINLHKLHVECDCLFPFVIRFLPGNHIILKTEYKGVHRNILRDMLINRMDLFGSFTFYILQSGASLI